MKYSIDHYIDLMAYKELMDDSQFPCEIVPTCETTLNDAEKTSVVFGQFIQDAQCACIGCGYYVKHRNVGGYCSNSKSNWYLHSTGFRCDLKKSKHFVRRLKRAKFRLVPAISVAL